MNKSADKKFSAEDEELIISIYNSVKANCAGHDEEIIKLFTYVAVVNAMADRHHDRQMNSALAL